MREPHCDGEWMFREGEARDVGACVSLWVETCAVRDGHAVAGVAQRARAKFDRVEAWIVAERPASGIAGFVLATVPGSGLASDPRDAPVVGLLAVAPDDQGRGLGGSLLEAIAATLAGRGHDRAVLHVLADNLPALRLYSSTGWHAAGEPFEHALLKKATQTYVIDLVPSPLTPPAM